MILVNTTFFIYASAADRFMEWVRTHFLPSLEQFGCKEVKLLEIPSEEPATLRFAVQGVMENSRMADLWQESFLPGLIQRAISKEYGISHDHLLHFTSVMNIL